MNPAREDLRTRDPAVRWTSHARKSKVEANQDRNEHSICTDRAAAAVDRFALTPPQGAPARRPASAIGVMNTAHAVHAIAARPDRPVTARGLNRLTSRAAHDSVTSEESAKSSDDDSYDDGVIVFQTPEQQTSRPSTRGSSRHTASGGENDWTHVSAPVSPTASSA